MKFCIDGIIICGWNSAEQQEQLKKVLHLARSNNLKLNKDRSQFQTTEKKYLGNQMTSKGILPANSMVQLMMNMPKPEDKKRNSKITRNVELCEQAYY